MYKMTLTSNSLAISAPPGKRSLLTFLRFPSLRGVLASEAEIVEDSGFCVVLSVLVRLSGGLKLNKGKLNKGKLNKKTK